MEGKKAEHCVRRDNEEVGTGFIVYLHFVFEKKISVFFQCQCRRKVPGRRAEKAAVTKGRWYEKALPHLAFFVPCALCGRSKKKGQSAEAVVKLKGYRKLLRPSLKLKGYRKLSRLSLKLKGYRKMLRPLLKLKGYRMLLRPSSCHTVHELP
jgi:hypothetical protein